MYLYLVLLVLVLLTFVLIFTLLTLTSTSTNPVKLSDCDIWIISLERSKDRKQHLKDTFFYDYSIITGIDGSRVDPQFQQLKTKYNLHTTSLNKGQIGCFLSHLLLLEKVKERRFDDGGCGVIICEDDIVLKKKDAFNGVIIPKDCEMLFLGHFAEKQGEPLIGYNNFYTSVYPRGTHCYYVSPEGARKMLDYICTDSPGTSNNLPIDEVYGRAVNLQIVRAYSMHPEIAVQKSEMGSTINV